MAAHVLLDNITHKDLKIITERSARYGDNVSSTGIYPIEFRQAQSEYPIVFRKNTSTGQFEPIALFGLVEGENLFLDSDRWNARYIPLTIVRQPFLIGFRDSTELSSPSIHIDMDNPRVSQTEGESVFLAHGGNSPYLEHISSVLRAIYEGHEYNKGFAEALLDCQLLEPFTLKVELNDHSKIQLTGCYTVNEDKLRESSGDVIAGLHARGYLEHIYMIIASLENLKILIEKKNQRL